eukprot:CAMPEP_0118660092 /NCGR_PEP_ID=MMETSP0785-20121206/15475_1 /TAXON_ID=91992 /ORGANISM="Bolidomonas pacifica, Strain CCMP 1866" /LENGTH=182 /DNA_ID=CAMNT_0006553269 /DNA_START=16 /DNA_END=560 /DNA_ORIENTATION=-
MADAAAFFAKKKGKAKKKKFKSFNANKVEVSEVTKVTHVDDQGGQGGDAAAEAALAAMVEEGGWEENTLSEPIAKVVLATNAVELKDIKPAANNTAKQEGDNEQDSVAEQIRVEEIRNQLQEVRVKAREAATGDGKEKKEEEKKPVVAVPQEGEEGKKWISPRLRQAQAMGGAGGASSGGSG